jgi:hypothetical protein
VARKDKHRDEPPLEGPRWLALIEAHTLLSPQTGFATFDLLDALKGDKLRCMRRSTTNPCERERVPASFWQDLEIDETMTNFGLIQIYRGPPIQVEARGKFRDPQTRLEGWAYYVWKPDLDQILSAPAPQAKQEAETLPRRRPGPLPKHDWPLVVAAELIRRAKAGQKDPTADAMIKYCEKKFPDQFSPGLKEMQVLLRKLLLGQF